MFRVTRRRTQRIESVLCEHPLDLETPILRLPHFVHYNTKVSS